ncbi:MAG: tocopherol cyclase family protein [bacterium]
MKIGDIESANAPRWQPGKRNHYEVWYLTLNNLATQTGYWIRYTITAPKEGHGEPYCQVWFSFFDRRKPDSNFGLTQRHPIETLKSTPSPFELRIGENILATGITSGRIEGAGHSARWDLKFTPSQEVFFHFPKLLYKREFTDTTVLSPHLDTRFTGTIEVDGRTYELKDDPGDQTHLWGKEHAYKWVWAHCNHFEEDETAVLEALCAQVERFNIKLPPIPLIYLKLRGEEYHFLKPHEILSTRTAGRLGEWRVRAIGATKRIDVEISCRIEDTIEAEYFDPDGESAYCDNTEAADAVVTVYRRKNLFASWRRTATLTSEGTAHVEWGARKPNPLVTRKIILI